MTRFTAGPGDSAGFLLWHVTLRWQREVTAALAPLGLTHVQFVLLACTWWLNGQGQTPNQQTVAAQAGADVKMTSEVLRKLEARGLLARHADRADSRARSLTVTEEGSQLAKRAIEAVERTDAEFLGDAADDLTAILRRVLAVQPRST
jgi:DNA-binding MarR family transcriptional regulator